jgi:hypothetical protein
MSRHLIVDREMEIQAFKSVLEKSSLETPTILLIEAASGHGKSRLLELYREHCRQTNVRHALIDLRGGSLNPIDIMRTVLRDLKINLLHLTNSLTSPQATSPSISISDNKSLGQTNLTQQIVSNVAGLTEAERTRWYAASANAFFEDLAELVQSQAERYVLLFDTYEQLSDETSVWLRNQLLRMVTPERTPNLVVVVAGQKIPEPTSEWDCCCDKITLQPLKLEHWQQYAERVSASLTPEQISLCYAKHASSALEMAKTINVFVNQGAGHAI